MVGHAHRERRDPHVIRRKPFSRAVMALALVATAVWAGTTYTDFLAALAQRESSLRADSENRLTHYVGLYQMGRHSDKSPEGRRTLERQAAP